MNESSNFTNNAHERPTTENGIHIDGDIEGYDDDETRRMPTILENDLANDPSLPSRHPVTRKPSITPLLASSHGKRPQLQSNPTTALSPFDVETISFPDGSRETYSTSHSRAASESRSVSRKPSRAGESLTLSRKSSRAGSEMDEVASLMSCGSPTLRAIDDLQSLMEEDSLNTDSIAWRMLSAQSDAVNPFENAELDEYDQLEAFDTEFDEIPSATDGNEEELLVNWKSRMKHYLILSSAGKPIWSRHGDQNLINGYVGIIQTIISFYEGSNDSLKGFTAGDVRIVISIEGPLYLVAISKLGESDAQLRSQLEALYMQILSTLTLPTLENLFKNRPSTDLRRPLDGTETLLSSLADTFTKGSASTLLSALECLKIRKSQRNVINNTLLRARTEKLLYGLIVAGGRLVSVVRPKRHSLHPSDLRLIFNMLFEARGIKAGGGENWIPLCLPGFNNRGYLYMYVSFLASFEEKEEGKEEQREVRPGSSGRGDEVAVLLISAEKESFFELKQMRDDLIDQLEKNGSMHVIKAAVRKGRPVVAEIVPGSPLRHFLYKSRAHVQFIMPSFGPHFDTLIGQRRLMNLYHTLHASAHTRHSHLKILHYASQSSISLAWITPLFEFYCIAGPNASRSGLAQEANKIIQWVKREEERVFLIGGAVF